MNATDLIAAQKFPQLPVRSVTVAKYEDEDALYVGFVYSTGMKSVGITGEELYPAMSYTDHSLIDRLNDAYQGFGAY